MNRPSPSISVVIAVRNRATTLQRALDSVFAQAEPVELIVVDGASTDATPSIIARNAGRIAWWESKPDRGPYHAWNKALDHVTGEWIAFLGADDRFHSSHTLARLAPILSEASPTFRIVYGQVRVVSEDNRVIRVIGDEWNATKFRSEMTTPHPAMFHHRSIFERLGRFDDSYRIAGDYEFLLRELLNNDPLFVPLIVVDMGAGGLSDRPENAATIAFETHRARYSHGLVSQPPWRSMPVVRAVIRGWVARRLGNRAANVVSAVYRVVTRLKRHVIG